MKSTHSSDVTKPWKKEANIKYTERKKDSVPSSSVMYVVDSGSESGESSVDNASCSSNEKASTLTSPDGREYHPLSSKSKASKYKKESQVS